MNFGKDRTKRSKLEDNDDFDSDYEIPLKKSSSQFSRLVMNSAASAIFKNADMKHAKHLDEMSDHTHNLRFEDMSDYLDGKSSSNL